MTRAEAEAALLAAFPGKTVWLECLRSNHSHYSPREWETKYRVSVHHGGPLPSGEVCEGFDGDTLEEAMVQALKGRMPVLDADDFFSEEERISLGAARLCDHCNQSFHGEAGQSTADTVLCPGCVERAAPFSTLGIERSAPY